MIKDHMFRKLFRMTAYFLAPIALIYVTAVAFLYFNQTELLYRANPDHMSSVDAGLKHVRELALISSDGQSIVAWYSEATSGKPTILFCHGKGGNMADRAKRFRSYQERGFGVMFFDYQGFGGSGGVPTEQHLKDDARAAYDWLTANSVAPKDIALVGESLGTGVCTMLAAEVPVIALELEAGYSSIADIAADRHWWAPVRLLIHDDFDAADMIGKIKAPLLQQHGSNDTTIPLRFAQKLFDAAPSPKQFRLIKGAGHALGTEAWQRGLDFIEAVHSNTWIPDLSDQNGG